MSVTISSVQAGVNYIRKLARTYPEGLLITGAPATGKSSLCRICNDDGILVTDLDSYVMNDVIPGSNIIRPTIQWKAIPPTRKILCGYAHNLTDINHHILRPHGAIIILEVRPKQFIETMKARTIFGTAQIEVRRQQSEYAKLSISDVKRMYQVFRLAFQNHVLLQTQSLLLAKMDIPRRLLSDREDGI